MRFADRTDAGRRLAAVVRQEELTDPVVLALPRGGVPVAAEVARALAAPLDLVMVRKIGLPDQPEVALGAVTNGQRPELEVNAAIAAQAGYDRLDIVRLAEPELAEIARRRALYQGGRDPVPVAGRCAIIVDDGLATGATARVALRHLRRLGPARLVLAVPVAAPGALEGVQALADRVICLHAPPDFGAVGACYEDFAQLDDAAVIACLADRPA